MVHVTEIMDHHGLRDSNYPIKKKVELDEGFLKALIQKKERKIRMIKRNVAEKPKDAGKVLPRVHIMISNSK